MLEKKRQEKAVYYELLGIFKTLRNREQEMASKTRYREMMEKKVEVEEQRYRLGLVLSSEWLFQYQRDLADAKTGEIRVLIDYKIAVSQLEKAMGISLEKKNDGLYIISVKSNSPAAFGNLHGGMRVDDANEKLGLELPEGEYETVAGFVLNALGHIPREGEQLKYNNLKLVITEMKGVKIGKILITKE